MNTPRRSGWPPHPGTPRPYPVAALARALGLDATDTAGIALQVGIGRRWVRRYRLVGLTARQADTWATRAGHHVLDVWLTWDADTIDTDPTLDELPLDDTDAVA